MIVFPTLRLATLCAIVWQLVLCVRASSAQVAIGLRAGAHFSDEIATGPSGNDTDRDGLTSFTVAVPVEVGITEFTSIVVEAQFLRRGYAITEDAESFQQATTVRYNAFEFPVLLKGGITWDNFHLAGVVGPSLQYLASGTFEFGSLTTSGTVLPASEGDIDFEDSFFFESVNRAAFFGQAGVHAGVPVSNGKIVFDARYHFSISDLDESDEGDLRARGFSLTAGAMFLLGR